MSDQHFDELVCLLLEDRISEPQMRELVQLVKSNESHYESLCEQLSMEQRLQLFDRVDDFSDRIEQILDEQEDEFTHKILDLTQRASKQNSNLPWVVAIASLAACLMMGIVLFFEPSEESVGVDHGVAVVSHLAGELNLSIEKGDAVPPGLLELKQGYLVLEFYQGARMSVAAPAKLELIDEMTVKCLEGKIRTAVPQVAIGFTIYTPESKVVDLGTEFGIDVNQNGQTEVHVFDGEVETYDLDEDETSKKLLLAGDAFEVGKRQEKPLDHQRFDDLLGIAGFEREVFDQRTQLWEEQRLKWMQDDSMVVYYDFEPEDANKRILRNRGIEGEKLNGAIVGATWSQGPWPGKKALDFKRPSDRVRLNIPGEYESLTYSAWVRIDALDRHNISLLLTDSYDVGEVHWQLKKNGCISLGMYHNEKEKGGYVSGPVADVATLGKWMHLTTVIDHQKQKVFHYKNGELIYQKKLRTLDVHRFGFSSIGNWNKPVISSGAARNLNGAIAELMVFNRSLSSEEVKQLALKVD